MAAKKPAQSSVVWWIGWIVLTLATFFVSCAFWTHFIAAKFGSVQSRQVAFLWVGLVFGTWLALLVPLIIVMYNKVDRAYDDARIRREKMAAERPVKTGPDIRIDFVPEEERVLPETLRQKVKRFPQIVKRGQLVTVSLRDGRRIENVFVAGKREVVGVYGVERMPFRISEVVDMEPSDLDRLPEFHAEKWLRIDLEPHE